MGDNSSSDKPTSNTTRIAIPSKGFSEAIEHYIDYNRPDPLSAKQLRGLSLEWKDEEIQGDTFPFHPSHALQGTLQIGGDYLVVSLKVSCAWFSEVSSPKYGKLYYSCHASARCLGEDELKKRKTSDDDKQEKIQDKIRSKMVKRIAKDSYVSKILSDKGEEKVALLAQANIQVATNNLEERVDVSEQISEAIKRAIWSSAETPLDVVELILQFPFLPTTVHKKLMETTELANRAKLRLLEDAMVDACEQEGEDKILEDLGISSKHEESSASKEESTHKHKGSRKKARS
jgi:hypothetical protein